MSLRSSLTATPADELIRLLKYHHRQETVADDDARQKLARPSHQPPPLSRNDRQLRDRDSVQSRIKEIGRRAYLVGGLPAMELLYGEVAKALPTSADAWLRDELARLWQGIAVTGASP